MTSGNPFAPPKAPAEASSGVKAFFTRRPIALLVIAAFCIFQYGVLVAELARHWSGYLDMVGRGAVSPLAFLARLAYPTLLFAAGVSLLSLWWRAAVVFFGVYLAWGLARLVAGTPVDVLSLAVVAGCFVYSLRAVMKIREREGQDGS